LIVFGEGVLAVRSLISRLWASGDCMSYETESRHIVSNEVVFGFSFFPLSSSLVKASGNGDKSKNLLVSLGFGSMLIRTVPFAPLYYSP